MLTSVRLSDQQLAGIKTKTRGVLRVYRVLGYEYESDPANRQFVEIFKYRRGPSIESCNIEAKFIRNPEALQLDFDKVDMAKLEGHLDLQFVPPVLVRRSDESGIPPEQYILQAFFKGKMYYKAYKASMDMNDKLLREIDFVTKLNTATNRMLADIEQENGSVDYKDAQKRLEELFKEQVKIELASRTA